MTYAVELSHRAERDLGRLPGRVQSAIIRALRQLALDPYHATNVRRLAGGSGVYRLRVGDYRALYEMRDDRLLILVIRIGHRREVYRGLT